MIRSAIEGDDLDVALGSDIDAELEQFEQ